jgi:hypothetical protein
VTGRRRRKRRQILENLDENKDNEYLKTSPGLQSVENSLWKRIWTSRKADFVLIMIEAMRF